MNHSQLLIDAFVAGAADLKRRAALIDAINVFPVMDGDTGQNMTATLAIFPSRRDAWHQASLQELPAMINGPLLREARGNSGIILAQFIVGFIEALSGETVLARDRFAFAVRRGRDQAFDAVADPREGTMLTVMDALADACETLPSTLTLDDHHRLEAHLASAVQQTTDQLSPLKEAGVVDSGALGFHILSSGLTLALPALTHPDIVNDIITARIRGENHCFIGSVESAIAPTYRDATRHRGAANRYCVNLLIELSGDRPRQVDFASQGDSLNLITSNGLMKLHIHTNDPDGVQATASTQGRIIDRQVQDMTKALLRESSAPRSSADQRKRFRVVGDSSMSLDPALSDRWGVSRIDYYVNTQGRTIKESQIDIDELYRQMRAGGMFTTAQISVQVVTDFFDAQLERSDYLVFIAVGHAYTGMQKTVLSAREKHPEKHRISVLDSVAASGQQGVVALATAQFADEAGSIEEILDFAQAQIAGCREYLVIDDLSYLQRSGRIGKIKSAFASFLTIRPIVGHGASGAITYAKVRSHEAAVEEIRNRVSSHPGEGQLLAMVEYTDNRPFAEGVAKTLRETLPGDAEIVITPLSASSGVHMGPGTWGIAVTRR